MSAVTQNSYIGNGSTTNYSFTFPYLKSTDVQVQVDATVTTAWQFANATTVQFNTAPANGAKIKILRETNVDSLTATFYAGSAIKSEDLNDNYTQNLYKTQEIGARFFSNTGGTMTGDLTMAEDTSLIFEGATDDNFETVLAVADPTADRTVTIPNVTGTLITTGDTDTVTASMLANDCIDNANKIANDVINSEHYAAGSIDLEHMSANSVDSDQYVDGSIDHVHLAADCIDGDNIQDDVINSEHYAPTSIDTEHIGNEQVTTAKLDNDAVTSAKLADNAVVTANIVDANVTHAKLANDAVDGDNIADTSINSEHYVNGSIDTAHIAADQITNALIADNQIDSEHYVDGSIDHVHLSNDCIDADNIQDNAVGAEHIQANAVTDSEIATGTLDNRYFTETELTNGALDGRYYTETESDARYFNISTGDTIKDGDTFPDNDTTIATTAAINDRIIDLVDDVGGFVPIANELSFPNANPDVNNGTGTLVSIKALSQNLTSNGSGQITIANGTVGNSTVTITGAANSTTYAATFGMIVETTSTLNTYTFHRLVPKATEVSTVSGSISNVNTVAGAISNVNTAAGNITNINTVAGINANVTTVAGISSDVTTVANNNSNVTAVADNSSNINSAVANASNINSAVSNASNINSAVSNASNINSAVSNASNINTVAGSISNVNTAATNIASINTAASNIADVNNFTDRYQVASSNPTTDGGGNALAEGDLYFNTTSDELKVYNGGAWQGGVTATGNFAVTTGNTFSGNNIHNDNVKSLFGTGSDLEIYHSGVHGYIKNSTGNLHLDGNGEINLRPSSNPTENGLKVIGNGGVELYHNNVKKFEATSTGATVTGNITVSGNVDGRDVAADGTKLDGIETAATADQTASEIVSLLSDQNIATTGTLGSGNLTVTGTAPTITLTDSDHNPDFEIIANAGNFTIKDVTNNASRIYIEPSGTINLANNVNALAGLDVTGAITATGNIDGRDVAADGTKLDGIESGATADQTGAEIKTAYEAESDTNAFTDALLTKLNGIETSATADQSASEILTLIKTVDGTGSGLDADTLEGVEGANYLRSDIGDTFEGNVLNISSTDADCLNFTGAASSDQRGIAFNSKTALSADNNDNWLRLNNQSEFTNGTYTPTKIRADGGYHVSSTEVINSSAQVIGSRVTGTVPDASTLGGVSPATTGNTTRIVRTHSSGYIYANYFNTTPNDVSSGITRMCVETGNDGFIRHGMSGAVKEFLSLENIADSGTGCTVSKNVSGQDVQFAINNDANHANSDTIVRLKTANTTAHCRIQFGDSGDNDAGLIDYDHNINDMTFSTNGGQKYEMDNGAFHPTPDNSLDCGRSGNRWDDIRATNGNIVTSDRNEKNSITASDLGLDFINKLSPVSYKWNKSKEGAGKRTHYGLIAQDIETLLGTIGKSATDFAGFCKDQITTETVFDEDGHADDVPLETPFDRYSLRYTEFISPIIKAIQELSAKVSALEAA